MIDYSEEIRKRGGEWRGDTLNANTLLLLFGDRIRAATDGCFYVCYNARGLVSFRSTCQSRVNGRERAEKWLVENWEKVMGDGRDVDPIDEMSDAEAIAEVERVSGCVWMVNAAKNATYLSPHASIDDAYAAAYNSGRWACWGGTRLIDEVGSGGRDGGIDAAKVCASRALLKHWRDNPSDAPKSRAEVRFEEDIDAAYQALHDAGISEPASLADGTRSLTERADGLFDQLGEVKRALVDAGILDFDSAADGVRALSERASAKKRLAEKWHNEWRECDIRLDRLHDALSTLSEFVENHGRE